MLLLATFLLLAFCRCGDWIIFVYGGRSIRMSKKRTSVKDHTLDLIVRNLLAKMKLKRLYLFGSRARGDHSVESDYDLVAVVGSSRLSKLERSAKARTAIGSVRAAVDIVVLTEDEFKTASSESGTLAELALSEGREIALG